MIDIKNYIKTTEQTIGKLSELETDIQKVADICIKALDNGNKVIFCGNGGSAADSQHLAAELMGRFLKDRQPLPAIALTVDTSALTAIGNDYGYDEVFARQLSGIGTLGDVLIGLSTSGNSKNVINSFETARRMGIHTVGLTGMNIGALDELSDYMIKAPSDKTNHIQECHITIGHLICAIIEDALF